MCSGIGSARPVALRSLVTWQQLIAAKVGGLLACSGVITPVTRGAFTVRWPTFYPLLPQALVLRPFWSSPDRRSFQVDELVVSAGPRPRDRGKDWNVPGTGMYGPGQTLGYAGFEVVECQTELGRFELAVPRPDVPLVLHYLHTVRSWPPST